ncbi:MAG: adenylosuccinate synthase [Gammaproteobacteria bacterium]
MTALAVVGLQWGDEGKGKIVDYLAGGAMHVARFQGGHNAGHTLVVNGEKTALHLLPSGVLHPGAKCYIGGGVVVSPAAFLEETATLAAKGIALRGRLFVADSAALVLPHHVLLDRRRETGANTIGTTLLGIGPAHEDKTARRAIRIYDLYNGEGREKLQNNIALYSEWLGETLDADAVWEDLRRRAAELRPFVCGDIGARLAAARARGETVLLEGAQAVMLDIEQGTYPFVTSAQCLPAAAAGGLGAELSPAVLGVSKAYATRVGNGPFPTELRDDDAGRRLSRVGEEFGATTGRCRRCGWLDIPMLRHAILVGGCRRLALTKLDVLDDFDEIPLCVNYDLDGAIVASPPADPCALARCRPIYETLPGWRGRRAAGIRDDSQLPPAARRYIGRIEELTGASAEVISTGAARDDTIVRRDPFGE